MSESETIPQMRDRITELEKQVKGLSSSNDGLLTENRTLKARDVFREQGYNPAHAELYVKAEEGDITPDSVKTFADKFGLSPATTAPAEGAGEGTAEGNGSGATSDDSALASLARGGSGPGTGGQPSPAQQTMPRQEWEALSKTDPGAARRLVAEGRVQIRSDNPYVTERR